MPVIVGNLLRLEALRLGELTVMSGAARDNCGCSRLSIGCGQGRPDVRATEQWETQKVAGSQ